MRRQPVVKIWPSIFEAGQWFQKVAISHSMPTDVLAKWPSTLAQPGSASHCTFTEEILIISSSKGRCKAIEVSDAMFTDGHTVTHRSARLGDGFKKWPSPIRCQPMSWQSDHRLSPSLIPDRNALLPRVSQRLSRAYVKCQRQLLNELLQGPLIWKSCSNPFFRELFSSHINLVPYF